MSYLANPITAKGLSPAQLMINRQTRTTVPILPKLQHPSPIDHKNVRLKDQQAKNAYRFFYVTQQDLCLHYSHVSVSAWNWTKKKAGKLT